MTRVFQIALRGGEIPLCGKEEMGNFAGGGGLSGGGNLGRRDIDNSNLFQS